MENLQKGLPYAIQLSNNLRVSVDPDELEKVMTAIRNGSVVKVRQGIVNPAFIVAIVLDEGRYRKMRDDMQSVRTQNQIRGDGEGKVEYRGLESLHDIFADRKLLGSGEST